MNITVDEFKQYCLKMFEQRKKCERMKDELKVENKYLEGMKKQVLEYLSHFELDNFDTGLGKVSSVNKTSVKVVDKTALKEYMEREGIFEDMFTFNSNTINAFYKSELEKAIEEGNDEFEIDGLSEPSIHTTISMRGVK